MNYGMETRRIAIPFTIFDVDPIERIDPIDTVEVQARDFKPGMVLVTEGFRSAVVTEKLGRVFTGLAGEVAQPEVALRDDELHDAERGVDPRRPPRVAVGRRRRCGAGCGDRAHCGSHPIPPAVLLPERWSTCKTNAA